MKRSGLVKCCRWWFNYRRLSTMLRFLQGLAVALVLLLGVLRLIYLREIPYYIHRLFAFYFIFFGLTMLFLEAESRPVQKALVFWIYQGGKSLVNFFLACMSFFNVELENNYWWEYAIGVYLFVVAV